MIPEKINSKLILPIIIGDIPKIKQLVESGVDVNYHHEKTHPPIIHAYHHQRILMVKYLLEHGANPCVRDVSGRDFFYFISAWIEFGDNKITHYFLEYDFQKMMINNYPETVIQLKKYKIINQKIENEYQHLLQANELNLL